RDTLLTLAPTYKPNHDDGVQISAAPLWPLFRHKPWQKVLKDTWAKLPPEVQTAMREAGAEYSRRHGEDLVTRHQTAMDRMVEVGKTQNPPVTVTPMSQADRRKWIDSLPPLSQEWVKNNSARGVQAQALLSQYIAAVKARGAQPERDWER
ncbi:MAG: hypothetical protein ACK40L_10130, partial [Hydrogenophaga sp.]